ncbi:sensor histidine kinase [Nonomuraea rubra]|uniref:histidine kinase n=1 Tax=Nonomuraea rubra TaxID=46180 RepID=A0A7X0P558_9ACTN|nr:sensor histidine kinase [Nonomuraea rubra]MBB6555322.1 signal transduction histidine kinase [Nonomuraea rubra]
MERAYDRWAAPVPYGRLGAWAGAARRLAATRYAPFVLVAVLALAGVAQAIAQSELGPHLAFSSTEAVPADTPAGTAPIATGGHADTPLPRGDSGGTRFPRGGAGGDGGPGVQAVVLPLLALGTTLPLALLWNQPATAGLLVTGASLLSITAFHTFTPAGLIAQLIAAYRSGGPPWRAVALAVPFPVLAVAAEAAGRSEGSVRLLTLLLGCLAPAAALAGIARRARHQARADTAARQVIADSLLEHTARGERARIARELHDVVAHHISMVAVQAETARLAVPGMPAAGADRLLAIGDTARAALTEMRRLLGVLREDAEAETTWRPQPGLRLDELNELLDESREASGSRTRLILRGAPVELDPGVELAAYRIVQEALTNARRHAPGAAVDVELDYTGDALRLRIRDNGPGPSPGQAAGGHGETGGGHGLAGMRERAVAVGGELRTGPAPGGGFLVEARLPGRDAS